MTDGPCRCPWLGATTKNVRAALPGISERQLRQTHMARIARLAERGGVLLREDQLVGSQGKPCTCRPGVFSELPPDVARYRTGLESQVAISGKRNSSNEAAHIANMHGAAPWEPLGKPKSGLHRLREQRHHRVDAHSRFRDFQLVAETRRGGVPGRSGICDMSGRVSP